MNFCSYLPYNSFVTITSFQCIAPVLGNGLTFINDSPQIALNSTGNWDVWADFTSGIDGARYICILRKRTSPYTKIRVRCDNLSVHFTDLIPGCRYNLKIKCKVGRRTEAVIVRQIIIPANPNDCDAKFINEGVILANQTADGIATMCFMFDSTGAPSGFDCILDRQKLGMDCKYRNGT